MLTMTYARSKQIDSFSLLRSGDMLGWMRTDKINYEREKIATWIGT